MWGVIGKLLGTEAAITKGIEVISNGLDSLVYTEEEKATDAMAERAKARGMLIKWMDATQGQNIARRLIALVVTSVWLSMYFLSTCLDMSIIFFKDMSAQLSVASGLIGDRATQMNGAMMLILGFYFAAPHLGSIVGVAMNKFGKSGGK